MLADIKPAFKIKPPSDQDFRMVHTQKLEVAFRTVAITDTLPRITGLVGHPLIPQPGRTLQFEAHYLQ